MLIVSKSENLARTRSSLQVYHKTPLPDGLHLYRLILTGLSFAVLIAVGVCFLCDSLTSNDLFWSLIVAFSALILMLYLWCTYFAILIFRSRTALALAVCSLLAILALFVINLVLSWLLEQPVFSAWDFAAIAVLLVTSIGCFVADHFIERSKWRPAVPTMKLLGDGKNVR